MAELSVKRIANGRTIRSLLMAAVLLVAALAICWIYQRGIYSRLMGPAVATVEELTALPSLDSVSRSLVEINAPAATRLGFRDVTVHTRKGRETGRSFHYFFVVPGASGKPGLLLRAGVDSLAFPAIGELGEMSAETLARVAQLHPQLAAGAGLAPIMLEIEDPAFSFDGILAIVAVAAPLLFLGLLIRSGLRMMDFRRVPGVAALKRFGEPVDQVVANIDAELKNGDPSVKSRNEA